MQAIFSHVLPILIPAISGLAAAAAVTAAAGAL